MSSPRTHTVALFLFIALPGICLGQYQTEHSPAELLARAIDTDKAVGSIAGTSGASATGGATYTIPIEVTPGTNGLQPQLAFTYNSQAGNGLMGYGWTLSGASRIMRTGQDLYHDGTTRAFDYTSSDKFELDGQRLVLTSGEYGTPGSTYDTENASFARIELMALAGSDARFWYFKMVTKDGMTLTYGLDWDSKILAATANVVLAWRLNRVADAYGNYMDYHYTANLLPFSFESELAEITYTGNENTEAAPFYKVVFTYQGRQDVQTQNMAGIAFRQSQLLKKVELLSGTDLVRKYEMSYSWRDGRASFLNDITLFGADGISSFNATRFSYNGLPAEPISEVTTSLEQPGPFDMFSADFDGNGISDLLVAEVSYTQGIRIHSRLKVYLNGSTQPIPDWSYEMPALGIARMNVTRWPGSRRVTETVDQVRTYRSSGVGNYDFNGDGRDDILITTVDYHSTATGTSLNSGEWEQNGTSQGAWRLESVNLLYSAFIDGSSTFMAPISFAVPITVPYMKSPSKFMELGDFDADGRIEAVMVFNDITDPNGSRSFLLDQNGYGEITMGGNEQTISTADLMRAGDFDGDGRHELMVFRDYGNKTYHALNITDDLQLIQTAGGFFNHTYAADEFRLWPADFNGDGITDYLAETSSGWKTIVGRAHISPLDPAFTEESISLAADPNSTQNKILVADVDGNGKSDVVHVYRNGTGSYTLRVRYAYGMNGSSPLFHVPGSIGMGIPTGSTLNNLIVGDHNGDGKQDIIGSNHTNATVNYTRFNNGSFERLLRHASDGFCNRVEYSYKIHRREYYETLEYPLLAPGSIGPIVQTIVPTNNGLDGIESSFQFKEPRIHVAGRGFLGFMESRTTRSETDIQEVTRTLAAPYYTPLV